MASWCAGPFATTPTSWTGRSRPAFDLHSIGRTDLDPEWSEPRFVNRERDDYRVLGLVAGQRFSSPSIDAAGAPDGMGAYGAVDGGRDDAGAPRIALRYPDLYTDWERGEFGTIAWQTYGDSAGAAVRIDLYQDGPDGPAFLTTITPSTPDDGEFSWAPDQSGIDFSTHGLRIQVSIAGFEAALDRSREAFSVPEDGDVYYVDDASDVNDEYTPGATGDHRHTGKSAAAPKPGAEYILDAYHVIGGTVRVDTGDYETLGTVRISGATDLGLGLDEGFVLTGPTDPEREASLAPWQGLPSGSRGWILIELNDADFVTLAHLTLEDGRGGLRVHGGSDNFSAHHLIVEDHAGHGIDIEGSVMSLADLSVGDNSGDGIRIVGTVGELVRIDSDNNAGDGIRVEGPVGVVRDSDVANNGGTGLALLNAGAVRVERVEASGNATGIRITSGGATPAVIGHTDLGAGLGNLVDGNRDAGIEASGNVVVAGNFIFGTDNGWGLSLNGGRAEHNVVMENQYGISAINAAVVGNRVADNDGIGVLAQGASTILENVIEGNAGGVHAAGFGARIANNLITDNDRDFESAAIAIESGVGGLEIANNTIVQHYATAILLASGPRDVRLRNNVVSVANSYGVFVSGESGLGLLSDFNFFHTTGGASVGFWQGDRASLVDWQNAAFVDLNSLAGDPLFVDPAAGDFHLQSLYGSFHGGSLAPVLDEETGLPVMPLAALSFDAAQSPAIDRGEAASAFGNEPAPNGGYVNLGAYGNTAQASLSPAEYMLVTRPGGGESLPVEQTFSISWRSHDRAGTVDVELWRAGGAAPVLVVADDTANDGELSWTIPDTVFPRTDYLIRVVRADGAADTSDTPFTITAPVTVFYVNDAALNVEGDWTTASGDDANDGLTPATPKASIRSVLETYDLGPGDIIRVDAGTYLPITNIIITAADSGLTIEGYHDGSFPDRFSLIDRHDAGAVGFELQGADDVTLEHLWLTGASVGIYAAPGSDSDGLTVQQMVVYGNSSRGILLHASNDQVTIQNSTFYGIPGGSGADDQGNAIYVDGTDALISGNTITNSQYAGIEVQGARTTVSGNQLANNNSIGIYANFGGPLADRIVVSGNTVHHGNVGIQAGASASFTGSVLVTGNEVYNNLAIGLYSTAGVETVDNRVHDNTIGIFSQHSGLVRDNRVWHNANIGIVMDQATVSGNRVYANSIGIQTSGPYGFGGKILNNLVYANANEGLVISGAQPTSLVANNTIYQPVGNAVRVQDGSNGTRLRNNILWVDAGYNLYVTPDSQAGFNSDYNLLVTSGAGQVGFWEGQSFATQADWFYELGSDAHSISGDPLFVNPAGSDGILGYSGGADHGLDDDFREQPGAPTLDAGDPASAYFQEPAPNGGRVNIGRYGNTAEALASPASLVQILLPAGLEKFEAGQQVNIQWRSHGAIPPTLHPDTLLADGPLAYYRLSETAGTTAQDASAAKLPATYVGSPLLGFSGALAPDTAVLLDGVDDYIDLPDGFADFTDGFTAEMWIYPTAVGSWQRLFDLGNGQASDNIGLTRVDTSNDLQFFALSGNSQVAAVTASGVLELNKWQHFAVTLTPAGVVTIYKNGLPVASGTSGLPRNLVRTSNYLGKSNWANALYQGALDEAAFYPTVLAPERIAAHANTRYYGTLDVELLAAGSPVALLADDVPNTGSAAVNLPAGITPGDQYQVRVTVAAQQAVSQSFQIVNPGTSYYVNDAGTAGDVFTSAAGNNANSGKSPDAPMASLTALLLAYDIDPGDTIYVDTGTYQLTRNILITDQDGGVRIVGPDGAVALLNRGNTGGSSYVIELQNADDVTLERLSLTGAYMGIYAAPGSDSDGLTVQQMVVYGNSSRGILLHASNDQVTIQNSTFYGIPGGSGADDQGNAIYVDGTDALISGNTITNSQYAGIEVQGARTTVSGNQLANNNSIGIYANFGGPLADRIVVSGNTVHHGNVGIQAGASASFTGSVLVTGNEVYNNLAIGLYSTAGVETVDNRVHDNTIGIFSQHSGLVRDNRVWHNANIGIVMDQATVSGNRVYANSIGIQTSGPYGFGGKILNNLVYANANEGLVISGAQPTSLVANNTIYQPVGNAIRVQNGSNGTRLRNNILWVDAGYNLYVTPDSQAGFNSDYNLLVTSGAGQVNLWNGTDQVSRADWFYELGSDAHSISGNPQFVDPAGPDGQLGYQSGVDYGQDDNFHTLDGSPVVDAGDPTSPFDLEPVPHGGRVNIGLDGNTPLANLSPAQLVQVLAPAGLEKFEVGQQVVINWRTFGLAPPDDDLVDIDLMESGNPDPVASIASGTLNSDTFAWTIPSDIALGNQYQVRVTVAAQQAVSQSFQIVNPGTSYYVNDAGTAGDVFTSAAGNNANSGKSPDAPMASLTALLLAYDIDPGDTIYVDTGTYQLTRNILITDQDGGVRIVGPDGAVALLNRGNTGGSSYVIELQNADDVTLERLSLTGAYMGIYAAPGSDSDGLTVQQMVVYGNSSRGILLHASNDQVTIQNSTFYGIPGGSGADDQGNAIYVDGTDALISGNTITNSQYAGIEVQGARTTVSGNQLANNNSIGIYANFGGPLADRIVVSGNTVHHGNVGIQAGASASFTGSVLVTGNEVYNNLAIGLYSTAGVETVDNRVHDNTIGIFSQHSGLVRDNRVWHNANIGIVMDQATVSGNRVYANSIGIQTSGPYGFGGKILNNLVYANANEGLVISGAQPTSLVANNTIYQPVGNAIRVQGGSNGTRLRNNILWVDAGYDISVDPNSQGGFTSDRNLLHKGPGPNAFTGLWGNITRDTLNDWQTVFWPGRAERGRRPALPRPRRCRQRARVSLAVSTAASTTISICANSRRPSTVAMRWLQLRPTPTVSPAGMTTARPTSARPSVLSSTSAHTSFKARASTRHRPRSKGRRSAGARWRRRSRRSTWSSASRWTPSTRSRRRTTSCGRRGRTVCSIPATTSSTRWSRHTARAPRAWCWT